MLSQATQNPVSERRIERWLSTTWRMRSKEPVLFSKTDRSLQENSVVITRALRAMRPYRFKARKNTGHMCPAGAGLLSLTMPSNAS